MIDRDGINESQRPCHARITRNPRSQSSVNVTMRGLTHSPDPFTTVNPRGPPERSLATARPSVMLTSNQGQCYCYRARTEPNGSSWERGSLIRRESMSPATESVDGFGGLTCTGDLEQPRQTTGARMITTIAVIIMCRRFIDLEFRFPYLPKQFPHNPTFSGSHPGSVLARQHRPC